MEAFSLDGLDAIRLFLDANGRVFDYGRAEVVRLHVRDARDAIQLLGPARRNGLDVSNYRQVDLVATAGFMLQAAEMIVDDLLREVDSRSVDPEHVEGLRLNGEFIRSRLSCDNFFEFITDVAKEIVAVARKLRPPFRNYAELHHSLENLRVSITNLRDREVVFPSTAVGPVVAGLSLGPVLLDTSPAPLLVNDAPAPKQEALLDDAPAPKEEALLVDAPAPKQEALLDDAPAPKEEALLVDAPAPKQEALLDDAPAPKEEALLVDAPAEDDAPARKEETPLVNAPATKDEQLRVGAADAPARKEETPLVNAPATKDEKLLVGAADAPARKEETPLVNAPKDEKLLVDAQAAPATKEEALLVAATKTKGPVVEGEAEESQPAPEGEEEPVGFLAPPTVELDAAREGLVDSSGEEEAATAHSDAVPAPDADGDDASA